MRHHVGTRLIAFRRERDRREFVAIKILLPAVAENIFIRARELLLHFNEPLLQIGGCNHAPWRLSVVFAQA
jgi:hypothetical protein